MSDAAIITGIISTTGLLGFLGFCGMFRQPLGDKIREVLKIKFRKTKDGYEFDAEAAEQRQIQANKEPDRLEPPVPLPPATTAHTGAPAQPTLPPANDVYAPFEADMARRLQDAFGDNEEMKLAWALRLFSQAAVERAHEMHYRMFFTSQIFAIKRLNELIRVPLARGREVFDAAAEANPQAYQGYTFETWMTYLMGTGYIHVEPGEVPMASLTPLGRDFLMWMIGRHVPETKQF